MKVKTQDNPTTLNVNEAGHDHHCPIPTKPIFALYSIQYFLVSILMGHNTIFSFGHFVQAVERNGKRKLMLGGNTYSDNSKNS